MRALSADIADLLTPEAMRRLLGGSLLRVGYLRVSTSSGEQLSALDAQGVRVKAEDCDMVLTDVETGRNPLRAHYQSLRQLIDAGVVAEVVATQFSRLGRDSRESDDFVKLCDAKGVTCRTLDDGILTMATPEDLLLTRLKGSLSEGESMRLSRRVRRGLEAGRAMGKPMRKPCWGYRLSSDRKRLEPDPVEFPRAQRFLALLRSLNWRMSTAVREFEEPTPLSSCRAVRSWLLNPTIRGGIAYHQKPNHRFEKVLWDRHEPLLSHGEFAEFERIAELNRTMWGHNVQVKPRLLTGLCVCDECGTRLAYVAGRTIASVKCKGTRCSQLYRSTREEVIVKYAVKEITSRAAQTLAASVSHDEPPEASELRHQIASLQALGDPDLADVIAAKKVRLESVLQIPRVDVEIAQKVADPRWHDLATYEEMQTLLHQLVDEIVISKQVPVAISLRI